jgi:hypothetical protein
MRMLTAARGAVPGLAPGKPNVEYIAMDGTLHAVWFQLYRRGGRVILHHGHIRPVLIRDWSRSMDGIAATIWASQTTLPPGPDDRLRGMRIGYGRVPTRDQHPQAQHDALTAAGCQQVFTDTDHGPHGIRRYLP